MIRSDVLKPQISGIVKDALDRLGPLTPDDPKGGDEPGISGRIHVIQVCYRTTKAAERRRLTTPSDAGDLHEASEALSRGLELAPNRTYRMTVETTRTERQVASQEGERPIRETAVYYFRTGDVPGTAYADSEAPDYADTPLNELGTYIEQTIPRHGARSHYCNYDVALTFNETYAQDFYDDLRLAIRDRSGKRIGEPTIGSFLGWLPLLSDGLITYLLGHEAHPCESAPPPPSKPKTYVYRTTEGLLAPDRMYRVDVLSPSRAGEKPLHEFQFATSRFATATEHLTSGIRDGEQVVHTLPAGPAPSLARLADRDALEAVVNARQGELKALVGASDGSMTLAIAAKLAELETATAALEALDAELYDEADAAALPLFERLGMGKRPLPPTLEVIRWPIAGSGLSLLLLESPEPIDRRRLTVTALRDDAELPIHVIWNRDGTRALICQRNGEGFEPGAYTFRLGFSGGGPDRPDLPPLTVDGAVVQEEAALNVRI